MDWLSSFRNLLVDVSAMRRARCVSVDQHTESHAFSPALSAHD